LADKVGATNDDVASERVAGTVIGVGVTTCAGYSPIGVAGDLLVQRWEKEEMVEYWHDELGAGKTSSRSSDGERSELHFEEGCYRVMDDICKIWWCLSVGVWEFDVIEWWLWLLVTVVNDRR
jgi:hypothetical protein